MKSILRVAETKSGKKYIARAVGYLSDEEIVIPEGAEIIPEGCFSFYENIKHIDIPEGITMICHYAFEGCKSLKSITLPSTLIYMGGAVFENCTALEEITLPDSLSEYFRVELKRHNTVGGCIGTFLDSNIKRINLSAAYKPNIMLLALPKTAEINYI